MRAVDELALRVRTGNVDSTRAAAILEKACADAVTLAAQRFEAALETLTRNLASELAVPDLERACADARAKITAAVAERSKTP